MITTSPGVTLRRAQGGHSQHHGWPCLILPGPDGTGSANQRAGGVRLLWDELHTDTLFPLETLRSGDSSAGDNSPPHPGQNLCGSDEGTEGGRNSGLVSIQGGGSLQACPGPGVGAHVFSGDCPQFGGCKSGRAWAKFKQKLKNTPFPRR